MASLQRKERCHVLRLVSVLLIGAPSDQRDGFLQVCNGAFFGSKGGVSKFFLSVPQICDCSVHLRNISRRYQFAADVDDLAKQHDAENGLRNRKRRKLCST